MGTRSARAITPAMVASGAGRQIQWNRLSIVMPALVAGIHVFLVRLRQKETWMARIKSGATSPAMTARDGST
jgi:hypothetical protein